MPRRRLVVLVAVLAVGVSACGGDDEPQPAATTPELTVPGEDDAPTLDERPDTSTSRDETSTTGGSGSGSAPTGGTPAPSTGGTPAPQQPAPQQQAQPQDTPQNDTPPPRNSPAERFEQFCSDNPRAC